MQITAAVTPEANAPFVQQTLELDDPRDDEVLVRILGAGLCHTDIHAQRGGIPVLPFPAVLGHEGSGIVERVGSKVTKVCPGDKVLLSFLSCGQCACCKDDSPAYCHQFHPLNVFGARADGSRTLRHGDNLVSGSFFGQSSFASHALASERNVVKVHPKMPLEIAGILGCGVQTGAGAVMRSLDCKPGKTLLVTGGGSVGLSAVMAARARGLSRILLSESHPGRRALALELGATDVIDPAAGDLADAVMAAVPGGVDYMVDTTGIPAVIEQVPRVLARLGAFGIVGLPAAQHAGMALPGTLMDTMRRGLTFRGVIEGDSDLDPFIQSLMDLYVEGRFPLDKMVKTFPMSQINEAIEAQHRGECVKVVLVP